MGGKRSTRSKPTQAQENMKTSPRKYVDGSNPGFLVLRQQFYQLCFIIIDTELALLVETISEIGQLWVQDLLTKVFSSLKTLGAGQARCLEPSPSTGIPSSCVSYCFVILFLTTGIRCTKKLLFLIPTPPPPNSLFVWKCVHVPH